MELFHTKLGAVKTYKENSANRKFTTSDSFHGCWHEIETDLDGAWKVESGTVGSSSCHNIV